MAERAEINVVASCDAGFAQHLSVMLVSLLEMNPDERFRVFILSTAEPEALGKIDESCHGDRCRLHPLRVDTRPLDGLFVSDHVTQAAYYRLLIGDLLPPDVGRVLYLDSDIVVAGPIAELWNQDLEDNVIGAVQDEVFSLHRKLGFAEEESYFNSGVLLIDLERWRREKVGAAAIAVARDESHRITWWDQCALNIALRGRWKPLHRKWNLQTHALGRFAGDDFIPAREAVKQLETAVVVHFTTGSKPWLRRCTHPYRARYWHYLGKTPWRDYRLPAFSVRAEVSAFFARYFPSLLRTYWALRRRERKSAT